ncbi:MAG: sulfurtransferase [Xanthobacteraceae bacterium]|nr:MAG: sulfurtransferase [Xanthobacteraceae bacterium]
MPDGANFSSEHLFRLIGTAAAPALIDVRTDEDFAADRRLIPGSGRKSHATVPQWGGACRGRAVAVICDSGGKLSEGVAAWLRQIGAAAVVLDGGFSAWRQAGLPLVPAARIPASDAGGRTVWVTRSRPKIDRIACPWLIRRFIDPDAVFLFVAPSEVAAVAERFAATPFDIPDVFWSHRGERCTFDVMVEEFALSVPALERLAVIVRGADTARPALAPQAPGLLAVSLGLSRMFDDDLAQLEAGMPLYDALYRWCRDAADETHNWPSPAARE